MVEAERLRLQRGVSRITGIETTLLMLKPAGMLNYAEIMRMLDRTCFHNCLCVDWEGSVKLTKYQGMEFYKMHEGKWFREPMAKQISRRELYAFVITGLDAIGIIRRLRGDTNPVVAYSQSPSSICGQFGQGDMTELAKILEVVDTAAHASDSAEHAAHEIAVVKKAKV